MRPDRRRILRTVFMPVALLGAKPARAQAQYPDKPIRVVVPFPAGGQTDVVARMLVKRAEPLLGQPFVVDNRPGASSVIGTDAVAKSAPDGYTLLFNQTAIVTNQVLLPRLPYDAFKDFSPVFRAYESAAVWAVPPNGPKTLAEFIRQARSASTSLNFGTAGHGTSSHFFGEILARAAGVPFTHVAYKGEPPILPDLIAGRLDAGVISTASALQYGGDGRVRVLAVSGSRRMAALPDLATFEEQGVPGIAAESFTGFFAPAATPRPIIDRLHAAFSRVAGLPEIAEKMLANGLEVAPPTSVEQFAGLMRKAQQDWVEIKRSSQIRID